MDRVKAKAVDERAMRSGDRYGGGAALFPRLARLLSFYSGKRLVHL